MDTVYVPQYDPAAVYGQPLPVYGGYRYVEVPPPAPVAGVPVMAGLLGFGTAIVLAGVHGQASVLGLECLEYALGRS